MVLKNNFFNLLNYLLTVKKKQCIMASSRKGSSAAKRVTSVKQVVKRPLATRTAATKKPQQRRVTKRIIYKRYI